MQKEKVVDLSQVTSLKVDETHVDTSNYVESSNRYILSIRRLSSLAIANQDHKI